MFLVFVVIIFKWIYLYIDIYLNKIKNNKYFKNLNFKKEKCKIEK